MSRSVSMATPTLPTSPSARWMIGVIADLGGQVEGDAEAGLSLLQEIAIAAVGLLRRGEPGVLTHGPHPAPVHGGLYAARKGIGAGKPEGFEIIEPALIRRGVKPLDGDSGVVTETPFAFPGFCRASAPRNGSRPPPLRRDDPLQRTCLLPFSRSFRPRARSCTCDNRDPRGRRCRGVCLHPPPEAGGPCS